MEESQDKFKRIIDSMFDKFASELPSVSDKIPEAPEAKKKETDVTESIPVGKSQEEFAVGKAKEEIEAIRSAFLEFQEKVGDTVMYSYLINQLEQFAQYASDLSEVIEDNIDEKQLTQTTLNKYKSIKQFRVQMLSNIINKYKKNREDN